tara:strand:+ start:1629 stop:3539 length:1911 start_codon:yes stop_codon:yes gene_type:complete
MAVEKTFKVEADTSDIDKKLDALADSIEDVGDAAKETAKNVSEVAEAVEESSKATKENTEAGKSNLASLKKLTKGVSGFGLAIKATGIKFLIDGLNFLKDAALNTQPVMDALEKVSVGLSIAFDTVFEAVSKSNVSFEKTGAVLGGIVRASLNVLVLSLESIKLGLLVTQRAWENSFLGNKDPDKLAALNAEIEETKSKIAETGLALAENAKDVATNFVDAVGEIANGISEVVTNAADAIQSIDLKEVTKQAEAIVALRRQSEEADLRINQIQTEYVGLIEAAESLQNEENISISRREELIREANRLRVESLNKQKQQLSIQAESLRQQFELSGLEEDRIAYEEKLNDVKQVQTDIDSSNLQLTEELRDLDQERFDAQVEAGERAIELAEIERESALIAERSEEKKLEIQKTNLEEIKNLRLTALQEQMAQLDIESELYKQLADEKKVIEAEYQNEVQELDNETFELRKEKEEELRDAKFDIANSGLEAVSALAEAFAGDDEERAKKAFAIQKRMSQGQALVSTYQAIIGALKAEGADGLLPFPVRLANAAIAGATGLAQVASIQATQFGGSGGGNIDTPTAPSQTPQFNVVGTSGINQLAQSVSQERPVKAYVVSGDVTTQQELDRKKVNTASFG